MRPQLGAWIEVDQSALISNFRAISEFVGPKVGIIAVVKANAYGHGLIECAKIFAQAGAAMIGVGEVEEGIVLREAGLNRPILVLGSSFASEIAEALRHQLILSVLDYQHAQVIDQVAKKGQQSAEVHLKVDTGMARLGIWIDEARETIEKMAGLTNLRLAGLFTHFPRAATKRDMESSRPQLARFDELLADLQKMGITFPTVHAASSGILLGLSEARFDLVRPGLILYGLAPSPEWSPVLPLLPALSFRARIAQVKTVPPQTFVGYGGTYQTKRSTKLAILPVGYKDGYDRRLSNQAAVLISGQRARVVGRISMGLTTVDVSRIKKVEVGDELVLVGRSGEETVTIDELADVCGTVNYEFVTRLSSTLPRRFM